MPPPAEGSLPGVPLFQGLSPEALTLLERCATEVRFEPEAQLLRRGEDAEVFYVIRHGSVLLETFVPARGAVPVETLEAGEVVGLSWLRAPYRWELDARALTPVAAIAFDAVGLRSMLRESPVLGYDVMTRLSRPLLDRLQWTRLRLLDVYRPDARR